MSLYVVQCICIYTYGLPKWLSGKESACNAGDPSLISGSGRSPGEGIGYPLQYSWASLVSSDMNIVQILISKSDWFSICVYSGISLLTPNSIRLKWNMESLPFHKSILHFTSPWYSHEQHFSCLSWQFWGSPLPFLHYLLILPFISSFCLFLLLYCTPRLLPSHLAIITTALYSFTLPLTWFFVLSMMV